ncbi:Zinc finger MYM-type protein 5 [Orchesella cincta]|uniref:Zinc finger MYM-type protein 5 n=1 Tax=Orchesella cincta TaxID=48709 RepID=A0A1D2M2X6_ORCCI|nr:Zinc finger MYM-type protein 5 [Orchesella cincta]
MELAQPDTETKITIMQLGPCQPDIDFPENSRGRRFAASYYQLKTTTGLRIQRKWLCYSLRLDKVYCETCWLFGNRGSPYYRSEWTNGIDDWQHLSQKIITHETSMSHIQSMKSRIDYEDNKTIKSSFDREILREADKWKQVLQRIFKTILSLCASNNPLRGHKEKSRCLRKSWQLFEGTQTNCRVRSHFKRRAS